MLLRMYHPLFLKMIKYLAGALHRKSLSRAGLAVRYHGGVEALEEVLDQLRPGHSVHLGVWVNGGGRRGRTYEKRGENQENTHCTRHDKEETEDQTRQRKRSAAAAAGVQQLNQVRSMLTSFQGMRKAFVGLGAEVHQSHQSDPWCGKVLMYTIPATPRQEGISPSTRSTPSPSPPK